MASKPRADLFWAIRIVASGRTSSNWFSFSADHNYLVYSDLTKKLKRFVGDRFETVCVEPAVGLEPTT